MIGDRRTDYQRFIDIDIHIMDEMETKNKKIMYKYIVLRPVANGAKSRYVDRKHTE